MYRRERQRGYSLAELLTVVAMVGVVTLVTIPAFMQLMPQYRIRSVAAEASSAIRHVRQKALSTRVPWRITFDAANERYSYAMLTSSGADMAVAGNWIPMRSDGRQVSASEAWITMTGVDLRTNTTNPFKDVVCPLDSKVDLIFLRDGTVSTKARCTDAATNVLTFSPDPSIVFAVNSNLVRFNRYYLSVSQAGAVTITPAKE
ncbi:MAG TPA: prepilin-type N-terminal cleavage/methylation domain-containing protein [Thermoanaerobaculia bacterium]